MATTTNKTKKLSEQIIDSLKKFQKQLVEDKKNGIYWTYQHKGYEKYYSRALSKDNRTLNCVILVNWALRDIGLIDTGLLNHKNGKPKYGSPQTKNTIKENFDVIKMNDTQKNLAKMGLLKRGDILIHNGHMSVFLKYKDDKVYCYDGGRGNCNGYYEGARFNRFFGRSPYENMVVNYVVREKE